MTLATVDADGLPNARMVLLKGFDERGFVFYTNLGSVKGHVTRRRAEGGADFYWKSLQRQVRLRGLSNRYRRRKPTPILPAARAWRRSAPGPASNPTPLESRLAFEKAIARYTAKFAIGAVP